MNLTIAASTALLIVGTSLAHAADTPIRRDAGPAGGVRIGVLECGIGGGVGYVLGSAMELD